MLKLPIALAGVLTFVSAPLGPLQWDHRPVVVFAPSADDRRLVRQTALLTEAARSLRDRDMAVYLVADGTVRAIRGPQLGADATALRSHYRAGQGHFTVILVGKDGGEKFRAERVVEPDELFALIDTMPMRRREMRERPAGG